MAPRLLCGRNHKSGGPFGAWWMAADLWFFPDEVL